MSLLTSLAVLATLFAAAALFALLLVTWQARTERLDTSEADAFASFGDAMRGSGYRDLRVVREHNHAWDDLAEAPWPRCEDIVTVHTDAQCLCYISKSDAASRKRGAR